MLTFLFSQGYTPEPPYTRLIVRRQIEMALYRQKLVYFVLAAKTRRKLLHVHVYRLGIEVERCFHSINIYICLINNKK